MRRLYSASALLLVLSCLDAKESALFTSAAPRADGGGAGTGEVAPSAGTGTVSSSGTAGAIGSGGGGSFSGSGGAGGDLPLPTSAGGVSDDEPGGSAGQAATPRVRDCAMVMGATTSPLDGHCYRVDHQNLDFGSAQRACRAAGGHLVSIGSSEENEYVAELHDGEHWLGASDGRSDTEGGPGSYAWVSGDAWTYSAWAQGQPNAFETDCPEPSDDESDCFEHCAFQTADGDWNDRSCWHTIVSVCEWEPGAGGAAAL